MTQPVCSRDESSKKDRLPRKDWVVMPLLVLLTVFAVCCTSEVIAKRKLGGLTSSKHNCRPYKDPWINVLRPADCTYVETDIESGSVEYHLNDHGYREDANLSPKKPGTFRIVMVGTSFGYGGGSPKDQTIANLLPAELSRRTGRRVELYNESIAGFPGLPQNFIRRFPDVLAAQPDLILWQMTRWDIKADDMIAPDEGLENLAAPAAWEQKASLSNAGHSSGSQFPAFVHRLKDLVSSARALYLGSRSAVMLTNLLGRSQDEFIKSSLKGPDTMVGYLKADRSELWAEREARFDAQLAILAGKARAAKVPLVLTVLPTRVQVAMVSNGEWPPIYDPYRLDKDVQAIATNRGVVYVDVLKDFRNVASAERGYRTGDSHPNAAGNRRLASFLAQELRNELPGIFAAVTSGAGQERGL